MILFIGFDSKFDSKKIVFETRQKINQFDFGVFFSIENTEFSSKIIIEPKTDVSNFNFDKFSLVSKFNGSLFNSFSNDINTLTRHVYFFFNMINALDKTDRKYKRLLDYFTVTLAKVELLSSSFEICIFILAHYWMNIKLEKSVCFNFKQEICLFFVVGSVVRTLFVSSI